MVWKEIHKKALTLSKQFKNTQTALLDVLEQVDTHRVFERLGYHSLWEYCLKALELSPTDTDCFVRISRKSRQVPELKQAVQKGEINLSAARKLCSVINPVNKNSWLQKASILPQRKLLEEIVKVNPKEKIKDKLKPCAPERIELHCSVSPEVEALIKKVQNLESNRQKTNCTLEEAFKQMASCYLERKDPVAKAQRSMAKKTRSGLIPISKLKKKTTPSTEPTVIKRPIPSSIRQEVFLRDRGKCVFVDSAQNKCEQTRFTQVHHIRPFALGGAHRLDNLATLCSAHHRAIHHGCSKHRLAIEPSKSLRNTA